MQFQGKRMIQSQENGEKHHFRTDIDPLGLNSDRQFVFQKSGFVSHISCKISGETNDLILRNFSDGRTDRQTDKQTDKSDFIGRCPTDIERPITCKKILF